MTAVKLAESTLPTATWTDWSCLVRVVVSDPEILRHAVSDVENLMRRVDVAASRFRADSELSVANANAGRPTPVSRTFVALLDTALAQADRSAGTVDPTLGRDLERIGYDRDIYLVRGSSRAVPPVPAAGRPSWRDVRLDRTVGLVTVPPGVALDLGASAKACTADWAAAALHARYGCDCLVEIGGDLSVDGTKSDWQIVAAERAGEAGQQITLKGGGLATSTTVIRRWRRGDQQVNHIIDPRTGRSATGPWRTVTVAANSATEANTCSTAAIVLGDGALAWLSNQPVAARLISESGEVATIGGWPVDQRSELG